MSTPAQEESAPSPAPPAAAPPGPAAAPAAPDTASPAGPIAHVACRQCKRLLDAPDLGPHQACARCGKCWHATCLASDAERQTPREFAAAALALRSAAGGSGSGSGDASGDGDEAKAAEAAAAEPKAKAKAKPAPEPAPLPLPEDVPEQWHCARCRDTVVRRAGKEREKRDKAARRAEEKAERERAKEEKKEAREKQREEQAKQRADRDAAKAKRLREREVLQMLKKSQGGGANALRGSELGIGGPVFPMEDCQLARDHPADPPLPARPPVRPEDEHASALLGTWDALSGVLGKAVGLDRFSLRAYRAALARDGDEVAPLAAQIHLRLLKALCEEPEAEAGTEVDPDDDFEGAAEDLSEADARLRYPLTDGTPTFDWLSVWTWPAQLDVVVHTRPRLFAFVDAELPDLTRRLARDGYGALGLGERLRVVRALCDAALNTKAVAGKLREAMDKRVELIKAAEKQDRAERKEVQAHIVLATDEVMDALPRARREELEKRAAARAKARRGGSASGGSGGSKLSELGPLIPGQLTPEQREALVVAMEDAAHASDLDAMRDAVRRAAEAGFETGRGDNVRREPELQLGLVGLERIEKEAELAEAKRARDETLQRQLNRHQPRTEPIGFDRERRRYFRFLAEPGRIFVQRPWYGVSPSSPSPYPGGDSEEAEAAKRVRPAADGSDWGTYATIDEIEALVASLDERGVREGALRAKLEGMFESLRRSMRQAAAAAEAATATGGWHDGGAGDVLAYNNRAVDPKDDLGALRLSLTADCSAEAALAAGRDKLLEAERRLCDSLRGATSRGLWGADGDDTREGWVAGVRAAAGMRELVEPALVLVEAVGASETQGCVLWRSDAERAAWRDAMRSDAAGDSALLTGVFVFVDLCNAFLRSRGAVAKAATIRAAAAGASGASTSKKTAANAGLCGSCGGGGQLLTCRQCAVAYHQDCVGLARAPRGPWTCSGCASGSGSGSSKKRGRGSSSSSGSSSSKKARKPQQRRRDEWDELCRVCGDPGDVLLCEGPGCFGVFHLRCAGLRRAPEGDFYCDECQEDHPELSQGGGGGATPEAELSDGVEDMDVDSSDAGSSGASGAEEEASGAEEEEAEDDENDAFCDACGRPGDLLCCDGCPAAFHTKCASLREVPEGDWYCPNCSNDTCAVCGEGELKMGLTVLCGKEGETSCEQMFHIYCVGLDSVPEGDWWCAACSAR